MSRRRILVLTSTFPRWAGDSTPPFVSQFCDNLAKDYAKFFVLAPHSKGAKSKERKPNIKIKRYKYFYPYSKENMAYDGGAVAKIKKTPGYALKLLLFMASLFLNTLFAAWFKRIKIINAHWIIPQGFVAVLVKLVSGKKVVVSVHGGDVFGLKGGLFIKMKRFVLSRADAVVVNSSATLDACKEIYPTANYSVIPMGVDMDHFKPRSAPKDLAKRYGLGDFTVLFAGRLSGEKGVIYLLEALKELKAKKVDFKALIVGDGPEKPKLDKYVKDNDLSDQVTLTGWVDAKDIVDYYNAADVFVGPSIVAKTGWKEALGLVFVEALASGVPVVATKTGGIADVIDDGETGFLIEEKSHEAIYKKLKLLHDEPGLRKDMAKGGREKMVEKFSWPSVTKRYSKLFDELV